MCGSCACSGAQSEGRILNQDIFMHWTLVMLGDVADVFFNGQATWQRDVVRSIITCGNRHYHPLVETVGQHEGIQVDCVHIGVAAKQGA